VLLNLAPYADTDAGLVAAVDYLVLNETEAAALAGRELAEPAELLRALQARRKAKVVITAGASGAWTTDRGGPVAAPPPAIEAVDTTGAGDAFVGYLAARLDAGDELVGAMRHAVAAASLSCTRPGAQSGIPHAQEVAALAGRTGEG
jgi:ribokinase